MQVAALGHFVAFRYSAQPAMQIRKLAALCILAGCGAGSNAADVDAGSQPVDGTPQSATPMVPAPTGTCPRIVNGDVTFAPAGIAPRKVKLTLGTDPAPGPLLIYWHATGSAPDEAAYSLGATMNSITSRGGVIAAPYSDPVAGQFEWFLVNQSPRLDDFIVADEIVACLQQARRIDANHIHSMGMSAGGLQTTAFSFMRSSYVASVATYSGGAPAAFTPVIQNPGNKFAALIFDGGATDNVYGVDFQAASERYRSLLSDSGHYAKICNHGNGHSIPRDAAPSVALFFAAHGFGAWPSPYASGLPASFPSYCAR
jgi:poly(3-hydroxybutyrate) depolymerase